MRTLLLAAALLTSFSARADDPPKPFYGFQGIEVSVSWTLDVESAVIKGVVPDTPAAKAGVRAGDRIIEIEGCAIPGCGSRKAKKLMTKPMGETLHLKLEHADGTAYSVALVGVPRPANLPPLPKD